MLQEEAKYHRHSKDSAMGDENCRSLSVLTDSTEQSAPVNFDMSNRVHKLDSTPFSDLTKNSKIYRPNYLAESKIFNLISRMSITFHF